MSQALPFLLRRGDYLGDFTDFYKWFCFRETKLLWGVFHSAVHPRLGFSIIIPPQT